MHNITRNVKLLVSLGDQITRCPCPSPPLNGRSTTQSCNRHGDATCLMLSELSLFRNQITHIKTTEPTISRRSNTHSEYFSTTLLIRYVVSPLAIVQQHAPNIERNSLAACQRLFAAYCHRPSERVRSERPIIIMTRARQLREKHTPLGAVPSPIWYSRLLFPLRTNINASLPLTYVRNYI